MAIPTYETFMLPLLRLAAQGTVKMSDAYERLADAFNLSEEERERVLPSGKQTVIRSRIGWARTYLTKANPPRIDDNYLRRFPEFVTFKDGRTRSASHDAPSLFVEAGAEEAMSEAEPAITPDEAIRAAHAELENALAQELLARILDKSPAFFERLVVQLLVAMGFGGSVEGAGRALGKSGDGGVDGVIDQDALGLDRIYVQAKRYTDGNPVGSPAIRDFFGSLDRYKAAKGLFVTTSTFTKDARDTAASLSKRIVLIDGEQLVRLMIRYGVGCRVEDTLYLKKIDEDFFE